MQHSRIEMKLQYNTIYRTDNSNTIQKERKNLLENLYKLHGVEALLHRPTHQERKQNMAQRS